MSAYSPGDPPVTDKLIVHGRNVEQMTVYSWARDGKMHSAWPGEGKELPYDATKIQVRIIAFPGASMREIYLEKGARTHPHDSYEAVLFYQISGRRVQMVNEHSFEVNPGDVTLEPAGVLHSTYQLVSGLFMEFAMPAKTEPNAEAVWMTSAEAPMKNIVEWLADGMVTRSMDDASKPAPSGASRYTEKCYAMPGYSLIETTVGAGNLILPHIENVDRLYYLVKGRMTATIANIQDIVMAGDTMRSLAGYPCGFSALEDSVLVHTVIPRATS